MKNLNKFFIYIDYFLTLTQRCEYSVSSNVDLMSSFMETFVGVEIIGGGGDGPFPSITTPNIIKNKSKNPKLEPKIIVKNFLDVLALSNWSQSGSESIKATSSDSDIF